MQRSPRGERPSRGKAGTACDRCHDKKIKCDREPMKGRMTCTNCHDHRAKCEVGRDLKRSSNQARDNQTWEGTLQKALQRRLRPRGDDAEGSAAAASRPATHTHSTIEHVDLSGAATPLERRPWSTPTVQHAAHPAAALRTSIRDPSRSAGGHTGPTVSYVCVDRRGSRSRNRRSSAILPSPELVWYLLDCAQTRLDVVAPFVDWVHVRRDYQMCCDQPRLVVPRLWIAFLFALLAVGSKLQPEDPPNTRAARHYIKRALVHIDERVIPTDIRYCRTAFLLTLSYIDLDDYPTARRWLKASISSARQIGLIHTTSGETLSTPLDERGSDQRLWWLIYFYDRLVSLEYRDLVMTDDCPTPWQDREEGRPSSQYWTSLVEPFFTLSGLVPSVRLAQQVRQVEQNRSFQSGLITDNLASIDSELPSYKNTCHISAQPSALKEPRLVGFGNYFPALTILQYRQLLGSGITTLAEREQVLLRCVDAALETAATIGTCTSQLTSDQFNVLSTSSIVPGMFRQHLWRCVLLLVFAHHFEAALACLHASCAVDWYSSHACSNDVVELLQMIINTTLVNSQTREDMWQNPEIVEPVVTKLQSDEWLSRQINLSRNPWTILKTRLEHIITKEPNGLDFDDSSQYLSDAPDILISPNHDDTSGRDQTGDDESPPEQTMYDPSIIDHSMQHSATQDNTIIDSTMHGTFIHDQTMHSQVFSEPSLHAASLQPPPLHEVERPPQQSASHHSTQNPPLFHPDQVPNTMIYQHYHTGPPPVPPLQTSIQPGPEQALHNHSRSQTSARTPVSAGLYDSAYMLDNSLRPPMIPDNPLVIGAEARPFTPAVSSPVSVYPAGHGLMNAAALQPVPREMPGPHGFTQSPVHVNPVHDRGPPPGMAPSPIHDQYPASALYNQMQYDTLPPEPAHFDHLHHLAAQPQPYLHDHFSSQPAGPLHSTQTSSYSDASAHVMHVPPHSQSFTSTDSIPSEAFIPRDLMGGSQGDSPSVCVAGYETLPAYYVPPRTQAPS